MKKTTATDLVQAELSAHSAVLFMKGTPEYPMCEFSERAVRALVASQEPFHAVNVMANPEIRAILPGYADWPTFPQLFIQGELIGGCDIIEELHQQGELARMLEEARRSGMHRDV